MILTPIVACVAFASAPWQERRVPIEVRFVAGRNVYIEPGRDAGLRAGDRIVLEIAAGNTIRGRIESVSKTQARAVVDEARDVLVASVRGYAVLGERDEEQDEDRPEAPPWKREAAPGDPNAPLLRLGKVTRSADRPAEWSGRVYGRADVFKNLKGAREQSNWLRSGFDVTGKNAFGNGGALRADAEFAMRSFESRFSNDDASTRTRIDRLEYSWGHDRESSFGYTLGRFLMRQIPEFGVLDGGEFVQALDTQSSVGAAIGFLPQPLADRATGDDFAAHLSWSRVFGDEERARLRVGVQKTWHHGDADRDLVLSSFSWRPSDSTSLQATLWLDWYDSSERVRSSGIDLTELQLHLSHRFDDANGVSLYASRLHWPDILRMEFDEVPADVILNEERRNAGASTWHALSENVWLDLRADWWRDRRDDGVSADVRFRFRDLFVERGDVSIGAYHRTGSFLAGPGLRMDWFQRIDLGSLRLGYDLVRYDFDDNRGTLTEHTVRLDADLDLGSRTALGLSLDHRFGNWSRAISGGIFVQHRF
ncbi:MAG: hypothetical protein H6832_10150 [Planctomycetes bacterium]|nr:hypothetical protein [Planctomycetota bacterium]MCB9891693.1 hypothetical protein [Planctomycetota bacterium]MCB9918750.1 hypothetical protein [Planctomycetota bacterium]